MLLASSPTTALRKTVGGSSKSQFGCYPAGFHHCPCWLSTSGIPARIVHRALASGPLSLESPCIIRTDTRLGHALQLQLRQNIPEGNDQILVHYLLGVVQGEAIVTALAAAAFPQASCGSESASPRGLPRPSEAYRRSSCVVQGCSGSHIRAGGKSPALPDWREQHRGRAGGRPCSSPNPLPTQGFGFRCRWLVWSHRRSGPQSSRCHGLRGTERVPKAGRQIHIRTAYRLGRAWINSLLKETACALMKSTRVYQRSWLHLVMEDTSFPWDRICLRVNTAAWKKNAIYGESGVHTASFSASFRKRHP